MIQLKNGTPRVEQYIYIMILIYYYCYALPPNITFTLYSFRKHARLNSTNFATRKRTQRKYARQLKQAYSSWPSLP